MPNNPSLHVRPYTPTDQSFVLNLAPRLVIGIPDWRDADAMLTTAKGWLTESIERHGEGTFVFVAENDEEPLGFAAVARSRHFTGTPQAEIGELAVNEGAEGQGVGRALVDACERWAREQGLPFLTLGTGAANERARGFYKSLGFGEEDVRLAKQL